MRACLPGFICYCLATVAGISQPATNCCTNCVAPYPDSYTVIVYPGSNFLANNLCQGANNTVGDLMPNANGTFDGTEIYIWNQASQSFIMDVGDSCCAPYSDGWHNGGNETLSPGEGFILVNTTTTNYPLTIYGCQPECPPPCIPSNGLSLVGGYGTNTATWSNMFSCPPPCGTEFLVFYSPTGQFLTNIYVDGVWTPLAPALAVGESAWVYVNTNQCPTNICSNGCITLFLPNDIVTTLAPPCTNCIQEFYAPTAIDTCCPGGAVTVACNPPSGYCFPLGTTTVTCEARDQCHNRLTCSFNVTVQCCTNITVLCPPPDKTVQCGSAWNFDMPLASSCCGPVTITPDVVQATPGACTQYYTETWVITDTCSNTATCSQTVKVIDTTAPVIQNCPPPPVIMALRPCEQLVVPVIKLIATDNCTPASQLVWSQSPPPGWMVSGTSASVTVTVTDACGNSSQCVVQVLGQQSQPGGLVVTWPSNVTLTDCALPFVSVGFSDPCCPHPDIMVSQWPPAGTICPGTSVFVVVRDRCGNSVSHSIPVISGTQQSFLGNLYNTGNSTPAGTPYSPLNLMADGTTDTEYQAPPFYALPGSGCGPMPADYVPNSAPVANSDYPWPLYSITPGNCSQQINSIYVLAPWGLLPDPANVSSGAVSKWITPEWKDNECCPCGIYYYSMQFLLPPGADPNTAIITGRWAADNAASMTLNNDPVPAPSPGFSYWTPFSISANSVTFNKNPTENVLTFVVTNDLIYTGLRVEFSNAIVDCCTCIPPVMQMNTAELLPLNSTDSLTANPGAGVSMPITYEWFVNGPPQITTGNPQGFTGFNTSTLTIPSMTASDAGLYYVIISNPCGSVTDYFTVDFTAPSPWPNASWNVAVITNPLAATVGPDLVLAGSGFATNFSITAGTTGDFGLPGLGGQMVNVMDINPNAGPSIQIPLIAEPGSNIDHSYTVIMDIYEPDSSLGTPSTLFQSIPCCVSNLGSSGQDGVAMTLDTSNNLHLTGSAAGVPFDTGAVANLAVDIWNRVAMVVDDPQDGVAVNLGLYLNGQQSASLTVPTPYGLPVNWSNGPPTLLSAPTNAASPNGEFDVASIQFYAAGLSPQGIASLGSTINGPAPTLDTPTGGTSNPVLTATITNGLGCLIWSGSPFVLQETTNLSTGVWMNSTLPFTETVNSNGTVSTGAILHPYVWGPSKYYRLVNNPQAASDGSAQAP